MQGCASHVAMLLARSITIMSWPWFCWAFLLMHSKGKEKCECDCMHLNYSQAYSDRSINEMD